MASPAPYLAAGSGGLRVSAPVLGVLAVLASATIGFVGPARPGTTLLVLLLCAASAVAMLVPVAWLPCAALLSALFLPFDSMPVPEAAKTLPVGLFLLLAWQLRTRSTAAPPTITVFVVLSLAAWITFSLAFAAIFSPWSVTWSFITLVALGLFALRPPAVVEVQRAIGVLTAAATVLAGFAIIESFVLGSNPLLGSLYSAATNWGDEQTPIHRATTLIGHPLMNGTVFAVVSVIVVSRVLSARRGVRRADVVQLLVLVGGIAATQTRTGALAALVGLLLAVAFSAQPGNRIRRFSFVGVAALLAVFFSLALAERNNAGLDLTVGHRASVPAAALASISGHEVFGVGPRMSAQWRADNRFTGSSVSLENGYAQLFVSIGPVGMLIFLANLLIAVGFGLARAPSRAAAAGLATFTVAVAGFNSLESAPRLFVLLAVLMAAIYAHSLPRTYPVPHESPRNA